MAPAELEGLILGYPAVGDVAVIGVPDERAGELPQAHVVLKQGHTATSEDIYNHVKGENLHSQSISVQQKLSKYEVSFSNVLFIQFNHNTNSNTFIVSCTKNTLGTAYYK